MQKKSIHVTIHEYQHEYLLDQDYNISKVVREELDGRMMSDGVDPENWRESVEGNGE